MSGAVLSDVTPYCKCGCGGVITSKYKGVQYLLNHHWRGKKRMQSKSKRIASSKGWLNCRGPLSEQSEQKRRNSISQQRKGTHGYGRSAMDNLQHFNAHHWRVRSPRGEEFEFDNLYSWCRHNEWRFADQRPESKLPLWRRAVSGFTSAQKIVNPSASWYGWVLVSNKPQKEE